jgi:DNA-binding YbaB/EbfC family protein
MKLPKGFGGGGFQGMIQQAQSAMAQAQTLNDELEAQRIPVDKGPVKMVFNGLGELQAMKIDKSVVDPEDVEALEDLIVGAVRDGFQHANSLREARTAQIMQGMPDIPGLKF